MPVVLEDGFFGLLYGIIRTTTKHQPNKKGMCRA